MNPSLLFRDSVDKAIRSLCLVRSQNGRASVTILRRGKPRVKGPSGCGAGVPRLLPGPAPLPGHRLFVCLRLLSSPSCSSGVLVSKCHLSVCLCPRLFPLLFYSLLPCGKDLTSIFCPNFNRENDITPVLDHTFCVEHNAFGRILQHELKPNGRNVPVTEENKKEYVR